MAIRSREVFTGEPKKEKIKPKTGETWRNFFQKKIESHLAMKFSGLSRADVNQKTDLRKQALEDGFRYFGDLLNKVEDQEVRKNFSEITGQADLISDAIASYVRKREEDEEKIKEEETRKARKRFYGR